MAKGNICWDDKGYQELDERIQNLVKALHHFGIRTIWSCEGHIREKPWLTGILPWPWVVLWDEPETIGRLEAVLREWNDLNPREKWVLSVERIHGSLTPRYIRTAMLSERPGTLVRALVPAEENLSLSAEILAELQKSAGKLADFLKNK